MPVRITEQPASLLKRSYRLNTGQFIRPYRIAENSVLIVFRVSNYRNDRIALCDKIITPPTTDLDKPYLHISGFIALIDPLAANIFKYLAHKRRYTLSNVAPNLVDHTAMDQRKIIRYETIPEPEHTVLDLIHGLLSGFFCHRSMFADKSERREISQISRASDNELVRNLVEEGLPLGGLWYSDYLEGGQG